MSLSLLVLGSLLVGWALPELLSILASDRPRIPGALNAVTAFGCAAIAASTRL